MSDTLYLGIGTAAVLVVLAGIALMSRVRTARLGNALGAASMALMIVVTLWKLNLFGDWLAWGGLLTGLVLGMTFAARVKMIQMPEAVALLNGFGGLASALVAVAALRHGVQGFERYVAALALIVGGITFSGSMVAAGKLRRWLPQRPVTLWGHTAISVTLIVGQLSCVVLAATLSGWFALVLSLLFGICFSIRVGGADMPITISLLNSLSGVAGGLAGIATGDPALTCVGGVVGASGLLLTQIMCRAMNRSLFDILLGKTSMTARDTPQSAAPEAVDPVQASSVDQPSIEEILQQARDVIVAPGYGMALSQAQEALKRLTDVLQSNGARVRFAIHPVAGRMPGHMSVLLCEVGVPYEMLYEMDDINADFAQCDLALVVGANDTVNPAANTLEGTPIYGMPVLRVSEAPRVAVFNLDKKPGYAGVFNPLYEDPRVTLVLGDAKANLEALLVHEAAAAGGLELPVE